MEVLGRVVGTLTMMMMLMMLLLCGSVRSADNTTEKCKLVKESPSERAVLNRLTPLLHRNFSVQRKDDKESYTYVFQLCGDADGVAGAGLVQNDDKTKKKIIIGRYDATKAIGGSDWVMLFYENGEAYDSHCNKASRKAIVMISCATKTNVNPLKDILEDRDRSECFYLFELDTDAMCPVVESKLSAGSIILIVGVCLVAVYLIGGFLYQRLVVGAKGMEQIPNYAFWVEVGNLSADGCDFVCRSRNREEPNAYRGVASEPMEEEPEERDDHLLPM